MRMKRNDLLSSRRCARARLIIRAHHAVLYPEVNLRSARAGGDKPCAAAVLWDSFTGRLRPAAPASVTKIAADPNLTIIVTTAQLRHVPRPQPGERTTTPGSWWRTRALRWVSEKWVLLKRFLGTPDPTSLAYAQIHPVAQILRIWQSREHH